MKKFIFLSNPAHHPFYVAFPTEKPTCAILSYVIASQSTDWRGNPYLFAVGETT